jgi:hypothetical protein
MKRKSFLLGILGIPMIATAYTKETLTYSDYVIYETRRSKIDKDKNIEIEVGLHCPQCKTVIKPSLSHGESVICKKCGLKMQRFGNGLGCTKS